MDIATYKKNRYKPASSSKIWLTENEKKRKIKQPGNLNILPVTFDLLLQAGIEDIVFFLSYNPLPILLHNKGPEANQGTIGLQL